MQLLPRLTYDTDDDFLGQYEASLKRTRHEVVTAVSLAVLLGLGITGAGTGITSLGSQGQQFGKLRTAIDSDLERIEKSISHLQESLSSLAEMVLQNRRGLDLIVTQQGGLCAALREECCFYMERSGVVKDSTEKLREGLAKRKMEREQDQGGVQGMFSRSPWLPTLILTLLWPLVVLLLIVTFGPCILKRLVAFMKERLGALQLMVLRSQYAQLEGEENL